MLGLRRALGTFLVAGASVLACGSPDRPTIGAAAPGYGAATLEGDSVSLVDLRGQVVLLNLWATWCVPCRTETPHLQNLFETYRDRGLVVVGVS
jgi:thiol-disulfide isomerase/thioredoxin